MDLYDSDQLVSSDMAKERRQTLLAAGFGIPLGMFLSIALPLYLLLNHGPALMYFLAATLLAPSIIALIQLKLQNTGFRRLSEFLGYLGSGLGLPVAPIAATSFGPVLLLTSVYVDQGRYAAALKANSLTRFFNAKNPLSPLYLRNSVAVIDAECLSHSGKFLAARKIFNSLITRLDEAYKKDPNTQNWETVCVMQSVVVAHEQISGDKDLARALWSRIVSIAERPPELTNTTAYAYEGLSNGAVAMGDFEAALRYADLATEHYKRAKMTSKCVAGSLASARAQAHMALGNIEDAELQAQLALKEWGYYLYDTAGVTAPVYHVLGSVEMHRGNREKALKHLDKAASILRKRKGVLSPSLLPCLNTYAKCLRDSSRDFDAELIEREIVEIGSYHNVTDNELEISKPLLTKSAFNDNDDAIDLTLDEVAKLATNKQSHSLMSNVGLLAILGLVLAGCASLLSSTIGMLTILACILFGSNALLAGYKKLKARLLRNKLANARCQKTSLKFMREGKIFPRLSAKVEQSVNGLPASSELIFDVQTRVDMAGFNGSLSDALVYLDSSSSKPLVVATKHDAFSIDHGLFARANSLGRLALSLSSSCLVLVAIVGLTTVGHIGTPPEKVPDGKSAREYYDLGVQYKTVGWTEQGRDALQRAIKLGNGDQYAKRAKIYLETKLPRYPVAKEAVLMNIKGYNADGQFTHGDAEKIWIECINKYPKFEWPYGNLGNVYIEQGKFKEGEALLMKSLEINPSYVNAWLHLADSKRQQRDFESARKCIKKALELDPGNERAQLMNLMPEI